jgi:CheY-like chemotaxis protein
MNTATRGSVLFVDDDPEAVRMFAQMLRRRGYAVVGVHSATEALEALAHDPCDLVLLDVNLPDIDGVELCRRLRKTPATQNIVIVMVTGSELSVCEEMLRAGADDLLVKPISAFELQRAMEWLLEKRRPAAVDRMS